MNLTFTAGGRLVAGVALSMGLISTAAAETNPLGRSLAANCATCHGTNGKAVGDSVRLAGMPAQNIIQAMTQFKEGKRSATIMHQIAKGFTAEQIKLMAEYFAAQK